MRVKKFKTPDGDLEINLDLIEFRHFAGRVVIEKMKVLTYESLFNGFEWLETERNKWINYAKFLNYES